MTPPSSPGAASVRSRAPGRRRWIGSILPPPPNLTLTLTLTLTLALALAGCSGASPRSRPRPYAPPPSRPGWTEVPFDETSAPGSVLVLGQSWAEEPRSARELAKEDALRRAAEAVSVRVRARFDSLEEHLLLSGGHDVSRSLVRVQRAVESETDERLRGGRLRPPVHLERAPGGGVHCYVRLELPVDQVFPTRRLDRLLRSTDSPDELAQRALREGHAALTREAWVTASLAARLAESWGAPTLRVVSLLTRTARSSGDVEPLREALDVLAARTSEVSDEVAPSAEAAPAEREAAARAIANAAVAIGPRSSNVLASLDVLARLGRSGPAGAEAAAAARRGEAHRDLLAAVLRHARSGALDPTIGIAEARRRLERAREAHGPVGPVDEVERLEALLRDQARLLGALGVPGPLDVGGLRDVAAASLDRWEFDRIAPEIPDLLAACQWIVVRPRRTATPAEWLAHLERLRRFLGRHPGSRLAKGARIDRSRARKALAEQLLAEEHGASGAEEFLRAAEVARGGFPATDPRAARLAARERAAVSFRDHLRADAEVTDDSETSRLLERLESWHRRGAKHPSDPFSKEAATKRDLAASRLARRLLAPRIAERDLEEHLAALDALLRLAPGSEHTTRLGARRKALVDYRDAVAASDRAAATTDAGLVTISATWARHTREHPSSPLAEAALRRRSRAEETLAWRSTERTARNHELTRDARRRALGSHLAAWPDGAHAADARALDAEIREEERREELLARIESLADDPEELDRAATDLLRATPDPAATSDLEAWRLHARVSRERARARAAAATFHAALDARAGSRGRGDSVTQLRYAAASRRALEEWEEAASSAVESARTLVESHPATKAARRATREGLLAAARSEAPRRLTVVAGPPGDRAPAWVARLLVDGHEHEILTNIPAGGAIQIGRPARRPLRAGGQALPSRAVVGGLRGGAHTWTLRVDLYEPAPRRALSPPTWIYRRSLPPVEGSIEVTANATLAVVWGPDGRGGTRPTLATAGRTGPEHRQVSSRRASPGSSRGARPAPVRRVTTRRGG